MVGEEQLAAHTRRRQSLVPSRACRRRCSPVAILLLPTALRRRVSPAPCALVAVPPPLNRVNQVQVLAHRTVAQATDLAQGTAQACLTYGTKPASATQALPDCPPCCLHCCHLPPTLCLPPAHRAILPRRRDSRSSQAATAAAANITTAPNDYSCSPARVRCHRPQRVPASQLETKRRCHCPPNARLQTSDSQTRPGSKIPPDSSERLATRSAPALDLSTAFLTSAAFYLAAIDCLVRADHRASPASDWSLAPRFCVHDCSRFQNQHDAFAHPALHLVLQRPLCAHPTALVCLDAICVSQPSGRSLHFCPVVGFPAIRIFSDLEVHPTPPA